MDLARCLFSSIPYQQKSEHLLRQWWRRAKLQTWLDAPRNDSVIARNAGLQITVCALHRAARQFTGDEAAVASGGLHCDAHFISGRAPARDFCHDCQSSHAPSTNHIFLFCDTFKNLRNIPPPASPVLARLGWDERGVNSAVISQMATVRSAANATRHKRRFSSGGGERGGAHASQDYI